MCERCREYNAAAVDYCNQAMDAERRLSELQEAVRWLLECEELFEDKCIFYLNTWWAFELYTSLLGARAAVDALIGGSTKNG